METIRFLLIQGQQSQQPPSACASFCGYRVTWRSLVADFGNWTLIPGEEDVLENLRQSSKCGNDSNWTCPLRIFPPKSHLYYRKDVPRCHFPMPPEAAKTQVHLGCSWWLPHVHIGWGRKCYQDISWCRCVLEITASNVSWWVKTYWIVTFSSSLSRLFFRFKPAASSQFHGPLCRVWICICWNFGWLAQIRPIFDILGKTLFWSC